MNHVIIAGLGNPGEIYEGTRHNIGFEVIDQIASAYHFPNFSSKFTSLISSKIIGAIKLTLIKPQTYMNLSGEAIFKVLNFYKIESSDLIVVHDDLDLSLASVKMKVGGGNAGHNGLKSVDQHVGSDYYRLRIGIGRPVHKGGVSSFVLSKFSKEEFQIIDETIAKLSKNLDLLISKNIAMFVNKINFSPNIS